MNSLVDPADHRDALPRPRRPGVRIDLIIRGICCLRPGHARASRTTSGSSASSTSTSSTRGSPTSRTATSPRSSSPRPTGCRATSAAASRSCSRSKIPSSSAGSSTASSGVVLADNVKARELQPDGTYRRVAPARPGRAEHPLAGRVPEHGARARARPARSAIRLPPWASRSAPEARPGSPARLPSLLPIIYLNIKYSIN